MPLDQETILKQVENVVDPEVGISITEMNLIDKVEIQNGDIKIELHMTTPFCPGIFAQKIAEDVKLNVSKIKGVDSIKVYVSNHFLSEQINKNVNGE